MSEKLTKARNWLNGWRWDLDGWLVRARRKSDPDHLSCEDGFIEECAIAVRSHKIAARVDVCRAALNEATK